MFILAAIKLLACSYFLFGSPVRAIRCVATPLEAPLAAPSRVKLELGSHLKLYELKNERKLAKVC